MLLGCIADDFTGATDLAATLVRAGMRTVQVIGVPEGPMPEADAVVVALKSRTAPLGDAVAWSLAACDALLAAGAKQIFWKYCSTFDSTAAGNIGPVADALMKRLDAGFALACPAFPTNGRTIYQGHLFVGGALLSESGMENHPLTPMTDAVFNHARRLAEMPTDPGFSRSSICPTNRSSWSASSPCEKGGFSNPTLHLWPLMDSTISSSKHDP